MKDLSQFDGRQGRPAYFAYQGKIYEAGGSRLWKDGGHRKRHFAGDDLTDALKTAPHGEDKVFQVLQVAELVSGWAQLRNPLRKRFSILLYESPLRVLDYIYHCSLALVVRR